MQRFLAETPRLRHWRVERAALAPELTAAERRAVAAGGVIAQDLTDLTRGL